MIEQERLVKSFCDLVRIDSPSGEEEDVARHLEDRLGRLGFKVARDAYGNLIAAEDGVSPLLLSAHMDTVEPGRGIRPTIQGDRIVSDGTTILGGDCKAGIAAILEGLESIAEEGRRRRTVQLVFTREEEIGLVGAANLDYSIIQAGDAVVFDGNGPVYRITEASPTYVGFDLTVKGRGAHAGVEPEKGLSAVRIAAEIILDLPQGRLDQETTFNVGLVTGGTVRNSVPADATVAGEFRSHNLESIDLLIMQVQGALRQVRQRYPDANIMEEFKVMFQKYRIDPDEPVVRMALRSLAEMGLDPEILPSGGGTDANIMRNHGIQTVVVGMSTNEMHTVNEYVRIPDLVNTARFCERILTTGTQLLVE